ncbi:polyprenyl synthetase family protein [Microbacterium sp. ABRD28]|uniref:polyprenyl synthetase family protein n=1 Tax=Microbacterium sp. ABRD28 TaxID=2268461 RepID=UPI000F54FC91|nr:polyprenyl synthetase family protein [Microbacterium sp. ABRD28]AZC14258.1 polyprenyl synthetase family protein [Microbacterium sp. ABRD28]
MIPAATSAEIDLAIDSAVQRISDRAARLGDGFCVLGEAIARAASGGKRLRPALVVASFHAFGGDEGQLPTVYRVAAAFELLHTAFVVHDDVIDHDLIRRGIPNVGGEFRLRALTAGASPGGAATLGDAAGILAGDLLLHEAGRLIATSDATSHAREALFGLLDDAVFVSAAGELADVENAVVPDLAEDAALIAAARDKTAVYSFSAPLQAGAVLADADEASIAALGDAGARIGLAFQLVDDLIGAFGTADQAGKEEGGDLREAKRTPLIAFARQTAAWSRVNDALAVAHTGPIAIREAQEALEASGARTRLRELIDDTLAGAGKHSAAPELPVAARMLLQDLCVRIQERIP